MLRVVPEPEDTCGTLLRNWVCTQRLPAPAEQRLLAAGHHPHGQRNSLSKERDFSPMPGACPKRLWPQGCRWGRAACSGTHRGPWALDGLGPRGGRQRRHAQVRRATYTYGVVPQDVQLLHQLCDQDVLEKGDGGHAGGECQHARVGVGTLGAGRGLPSHLPPRSRLGVGSCRPRSGCGGS